MKKNNRLILKALVKRTLFIALLIIPIGASTQINKEQSKPNVIMIIFDDLRDHEAFTPFEVQTPNFDRLAKKGVRFDRAYCQLPVCNSSRASFLTGLRPPTSKVVQNKEVDYKISKDVVTLPQALKNNGYYTISIGKVFHNNAGDGRSWDRDMENDPGYRDPIQYDKNIAKYADDPNLIFLNEKRFEYLYKGPEDLASYGYTDHLIAEDVEEFLDKAVEQSQPFFLAAGFKKPHNPYIGPSSFFDLYPTERVQLISEPEDKTEPYYWATPPSHRDEFDAMDAYHRKLFMSAYSAVTTFSDDQMGRLLDKMDEHNLWNNTIIICFGDHGYHLGEHNNHWGKVTLYELSARVPMVVYVPGIKTAGERTKGVVELVDLFPTLADLLGITPPDNLEGESFKALLKDPSKPWDNEAFIYEGNDVDNLQYSIVTGRYRYTVWADRDPVRYELYDHSKDPGEYYNLIKDLSNEEIKASVYADIVTELEARRANPSNPNKL
ncbi:MAG: sulfatase [Bacteroidales bacterium]